MQLTKALQINQLLQSHSLLYGNLVGTLTIPCRVGVAGRIKALVFEEAPKHTILEQLLQLSVVITFNAIIG